MLGRIKYYLFQKLVLDICGHSNCSTCKAGYTWKCLDGLEASGCYLATLLYKQARKVWGLEDF